MNVPEGSAAIYAHSLAGHPPEKWETLEAHAKRVAELARQFADAFGAADWGELLGRWHDAGKASKEFQRYIRYSNSNDSEDAGEEGQAPGRVDHSTFGAQYAAKTVGGHFGLLLAFCIAGHHGGLADATSDDEMTRGSTLQARLAKTVPAATMLEGGTVPKLKLPFAASRDNASFQVSFFTRMLFSALIDADRTATEAFCDPPQAADRCKAKPTLVSPPLSSMRRSRRSIRERPPLDP